MTSDPETGSEEALALEAADPNSFVFERLRRCIAASLTSPAAEKPSWSIAEVQLLWWHHVASGCPRSGDVVLAALDAACRTRTLPASSADSHGVLQPLTRRSSLRDDAQLLELLTWVWRVRRSDWMKRCAEQIVEDVWTGSDARGRWSMSTAARLPGEHRCGSKPASRDAGVGTEGKGVMLVALLEAGSVMDRRDWLASTMTVFDDLVAKLAEDRKPHHPVVANDIGEPANLDENAGMARAALRLFTAFGKPRYLAQAETWAAALDDHAISGDVGMIDVLPRLYDLTGHDHYRQRACRLVEIVGDYARSTALPAALAACRARVTIKISGRPSADTRALLHAALHYGLPDRLVLGSGAGERPQDQRPPAAEIIVGTVRLPTMDLENLQKLTAPGGLRDCLAMRSGATGSDRRDKR